MAKILLHAITVLTLVVGICYAVPLPEPQIERIFADLPIVEPLLELVAIVVALLTGILGELLNLLLIGGLLESLLALGNEDPDGRR